MSCKVSFIGLGVMGYPMAGYISKAGHNVTVYNRTKSKAEKDNKITTRIEKFTNFISSIFFPTQIKAILLHNVAMAYKLPNSPCEIFISFLILSLNKPRK